MGGDFLRKQGGDRRCLLIAYVCLLRGGEGLQISFVHGPFCIHSSADEVSNQSVEIVSSVLSTSRQTIVDLCFDFS